MSNLRLGVPGDVEVLGSLCRGRDERSTLLEVGVNSLPSPTRVAQSLPRIVVGC